MLDSGRGEQACQSQTQCSNDAKAACTILQMLVGGLSGNTARQHSRQQNVFAHMLLTASCAWDHAMLVTPLICWPYGWLARTNVRPYPANNIKWCSYGVIAVVTFQLDCHKGIADMPLIRQPPSGSCLQMLTARWLLKALWRGWLRRTSC